jgi:tRNA A-37 threonylcarbamoyl transferase component Bud32
MLQQTIIRIPAITKLNWKQAGRSLSLYSLRPLQYSVDVLFHIVGFGFLLLFGLDFFPSPGIESLIPVVLFRQLADPYLAPLRAHVLEMSSGANDIYRALPLAFSVVAWLVRPSVVRNLKRWRARLEEPPVESLFAPRPIVSSEELNEELIELSELDSDSGGGTSGDGRSYDSSSKQSSPILSSNNQAIQVIGRYELIEELGRGPVGAVYKALDLKLGRTVALKVMIPHGLSADQLRAQTDRLYREARTAAKIMHPGIVTIFDVEEDSLGNPYIVMEYIDGETLAQVLEKKNAGEPLSLSERLEIGIQIARTLDYAHRRGVVHRDMKPSNVLLTAEGNIKIADFGIAMHLEAEASPAGQVPGTPAFVSPELLNGFPANSRSDVFSLGVVLYWMFTGEMPFTGGTVTEIVHKVAHVNPVPARRVNWALPEELDQILRRCLAKNPAERYPSAGELAGDLIALREGRLQSARLSA